MRKYKTATTVATYRRTPMPRVETARHKTIRLYDDCIMHNCYKKRKKARWQTLQGLAGNPDSFSQSSPF